MKGKKNRRLDEVDYWQSTSDLLISLLLVLLLVILLLGLYLLHIPDVINVDPWPGDAIHEGTDDEEGGGGGAASPTPSPTPTPTPAPTPVPTPTPDYGTGYGSGNYSGTEPAEEIKSAVYVMLVDAETGRTVKEPGVGFELYSDDNGLQILNTYYPERLSFRDYETTESGTFFLPEKIYQGGYYLRELSEPSGYDAAEELHFVVDDLYDWPDPYLVRVPVYPSRNVIRVQMNDKDTRQAIPGGSFEVLAAEDIITLDGTIRYHSGQVVGEILCDENGYGESEQLYLGEYTVRQKAVPRHYASIKEPLEVSVSKKTSAAPSLHIMQSEKTRINVSLHDELYETMPLSGVEFELSVPGGETRSFTTDSMGRFQVEDLEKGVDYRLRQVSRNGDYLPDTQDHVVSVDKGGRIHDMAAMDLPLHNRLLRVTIGLREAFLGSQIPDVNLALYDSADNLVSSWTTTSVAVSMNDLHEGAYHVIKEGDTGHRYLLYVENSKELQSLQITVTTWRSVAVGVIILIVIAIAVSGAVILIRFAARRRKERNRLAPMLAEQEGEVRQE